MGPSAPMATASPPAAAAGVLSAASRLVRGFCSLFICCCPRARASIARAPWATPPYKMSLASLCKPPLGLRRLRKRPCLSQTLLKVYKFSLSCT